MSPKSQEAGSHALVTLGASVVGTAITILGASLVLGDRLYVRQDVMREMLNPINNQLAVLTYKVDELHSHLGTCPDCPAKQESP